MPSIPVTITTRPISLSLTYDEAGACQPTAYLQANSSYLDAAGNTVFVPRPLITVDISIVQDLTDSIDALIVAENAAVVSDLSS